MMDYSVKRMAVAGPTAKSKKEDAAIARAEAMFQKMMEQGKVTPSNIRKIKEQIAKKTGAYPLGDTN
jgi:hypothetical protein